MPTVFGNVIKQLLVAAVQWFCSWHESRGLTTKVTVRVDLTVRLGRGVEGINTAVAWHFSHASPLIERFLATFGIGAQSTKWQVLRISPALPGALGLASQCAPQPMFPCAFYKMKTIGELLS